MAKKKITSEAIEKYNTDITSLSNDVDTHYTSAEKLATRIDEIISSCDLSLPNTLSENYTSSPSADLTKQLDHNIRKIKVALTEAEEKSKTNDQKLKENISTRSDEVKQLKNIISQYKSQIQSASSLTSPGLNSSLKAIGKAGNIDKIPGVNEGRHKRLEHEVKMNKLLSPEQIEEKIRELYRNLSDEQIKVLREYYTFKNMKSWPLINRPPSTMGRDAVLLYENGQYIIKYVNNATLDFFNVKGSMKGSLLKPGLNSNVDLNGESKNSVKSGLGASGSMKASAVSGTLDEVDWSIGNAELKGSVNKDGAEVSLGGNMAEIGMQVTFWEDDQSRYVGKLDISIISAKIKANLASDGIEIGTPGLIGIGVSGKKVDLIDLDTDL
ncbi:hypothetical protein BCR22_10595 [Enterococcus plantarum]|uniref:hypothetical protein n=1 Tax=Enterococcus plantarum TaxID=1077675 RepID=UPI00084D755B|nr:hypothetical protein [Enterococcus plantarum]OEG18783.1 hypothetical protein BCR22_10595 [Enterococcus plantarum]